MTKDSSVDRVFLVGCPRSGTTLLQCLLAANPTVRSFPESHAFTWLPWLNPWELDATIRSFLRGAGLDELMEGMPKPSEKVNYTDVFIGLLDASTRSAGARLWVEKTPIHLHYIDDIRLALPDAKFVHLLRNGRATISSLYLATQRYPDGWQGSRSIEECAERWLHDVQWSLDVLGTPGHVHVRYCSIRAAPEKTLRRVCDFLGVPYRSSMLAEQKNAATNLIRADEPWKDGARSPLLVATPSDDRATLFDELASDHIQETVGSMQARLDLLVPIEVGTIKRGVRGSTDREERPGGLR